jgi:MYXO-CTERM domain-containing protein
VSDGECNRGDYCSGGVCVTKKDPGTTCNVATECASGICADGYCCTQACAGQCEACNVPGNEGTCTPVTGAPRGSRQACASDGTACGGTCDGTTADRCKYEDLTTPCRAGKCSDGLADLAAFCQGNGSCAPLQQQSCDVDGCDATGTRCNGSCNADADCNQGSYCSAGECVPRLTNGGTCGAPSHCTSGNCVDGVCCDSACTGDCEACDQVDHIGTCTPVKGAPRSGRPGCLGSGACGGFCDGTNNTTCALPGANVSCGVAFCATGVLTTAPACNSAATCLLPPPSSCDPYQCTADGVSCLTSCEVDSDCATGLVCVGGNCTQPIPDAGVVDAGAPDGSMAAGGAIGEGGKSGAGGAGVAGKTGSGGASGSGAGTGATTGGAGKSSVDGGVAGPDAGTPDSGKSPGHKQGKDDGGCGCRVDPTSGGSSGPFALALGLALLGIRRRRSVASKTSAA